MNRKLIVTLVSLLALVVVGAAAAHEFNRIKGTPGNDALTGTEANDRIRALAGNDTVNALGGNDRVWAGPGNDTVDAGAGRDRVRGGNGDDNLNGGDDNDVVRGRHGNDTVSGGNGNDSTFGGRGADVSYGGEGDDRLHAIANDDQVDTLDCGPGNDRVWLNANESDIARQLREGLHRDHHECGRRGRRVTSFSRPLREKAEARHTAGLGVFGGLHAGRNHANGGVRGPARPDML